MAELLSLDRVYGDGTHCAFTDLLKWRGHYYLTFRVAESHGIQVPGSCLVLRSADARRWEVCARLETEGDDRDPKLVDAGDRLAVIFGTWFARWQGGSIANSPHDLISQVCFSRDGVAWSAPRQMFGVNYWLWRVLPAEGKYYCAAYHFPRREDKLDRSAHLLVSPDLLTWTRVCQMRHGGGVGEPVLFQPAPGQLCCIARAREPDNHSWCGVSHAPYTEWAWHDFGVMVHAPVVIQAGDRWLVAGRSQPGDLPPGCDTPQANHHTSLWEIADGRGRHLLTVPSAGDCSYCGLAWGPGGELLMSYYSQHERQGIPPGLPTPADVFVARIKV